MCYSMRHFRQTHASYQRTKRKQKRASVDIANDLYCAQDAISIIQSRGMRWVEHVAQARDETCIQNFGVET
jgi:uncharacterized protein YdaT